MWSLPNRRNQPLFNFCSMLGKLIAATELTLAEVAVIRF
jgi:hypothetical protein